MGYLVTGLVLIAVGRFGRSNYEGIHPSATRLARRITYLGLFVVGISAIVAVVGLLV